MTNQFRNTNFGHRAGNLLKPKALLIAACGLCALGYAILMSKRMPKVPASAVCAGYDGIYCFKGGAGISPICQLVDLRGNRIHYPIFCLIDRAIYYWSPNDNRLCILSGVRQPIWLPVPIYSGETVGDIRASHDGFVLNLVDTNNNPLGVLSCNTSNYSFTRVEGIVSARPSEVDAKLVTMQANRQLINYPDNKQAYNGITIPVRSKWDADPDANCICFTDQKNVYFIHNGHKYSSNVGISNFINTIAAIKQLRQVWVSVDKAFSRGSYIIAYDYDGRLLGTVGEDRFPLRLPLQSVSDVELALVATRATMPPNTVNNDHNNLNR